MLTQELARPLRYPKLRFPWRLKLASWALIALKALVTKPMLVRRIGPGLPPEQEHEFLTRPFYYR